MIKDELTEEADDDCNKKKESDWIPGEVGSHFEPDENTCNKVMEIAPGHFSTLLGAPTYKAILREIPLVVSDHSSEQSSDRLPP